MATLVITTDEEYSSIKTKLLAAGGLTPREAGVEIFKLTGQHIANKTAIEAHESTFKLINRFYRGCKYQKDFKFQLAMAWFRTHLPAAAMSY